MDQCIEQARAWGADVLWLAVWRENPRAIAFYTRRGFTPVGETTFVLGSDLQHDVVMALLLV
jgi:ribosomal protein S18 acetylase RimI-like enzyme